MKFNLTNALGSIALLLLSLLSPNSLSAQFILEADNVNAIATKIDYLYGDKIEITGYKLKTFLQDQISGSYDSHLRAPEAELDIVNDAKVSFSWPSVTGAETYQSRYFSLKDGTTGGNESANTNQDFIIPNDFYLYTFQSKTAQSIGPVYIIIEEKPLALVFNPGDCFCRRAQTVFSGQVSANSYDLYTYPTTGHVALLFNVVFQHKRNDQAAYHISDYTVEMEVQDGEVQSIIIPLRPDTNLPCLTNADVEYSSIFAVETGESLDSGEEFIASRFDFDDGVFKLTVLDDHNGYIYVNQCDSREHREANNNITAISNKLYPNPSTGLFTLENANADLSEEVFVRNSIGQYLNFDRLNFDHSTLQIDLSDQPNGMYFLELRKSTGVETIQLVKAE